MGMGMDTKVPWAEIFDKISEQAPSLTTNRHLQWLFGELQSKVLRVGNFTPGLIAVRGDSPEDNYGKIVKFSVEQWIVRLSILARNLSR